MPAGNLRSRLAFQKRTESDDSFGTKAVGEFASEFTVHAELIPRLGSEAVIASRLQGIQPYTIRVRSSSDSRRIQPNWRAVDARTGAIYSIVSPAVDLNQRGAYLEFLATSGPTEQ